MVAAGEGARSGAGSPKDAASGRVEHAHQLISRLLQQLGAGLELADLVERLDALEAVLVEHFAEEEAPDGLYEQLRAERPATERALQGLQREHAELLAALRDLRRDAQEVEGGIARVRGSTEAFVERARTHEQTETRLVIDTHLVDDGGSG